MVNGIRWGLLIFLLHLNLNAFSGQNEVAPGEYLVQLKKGPSSKAALANLIKSLNAKILKTIPESEIIVLKLNDHGDVKGTIDNIKMNNGISIVEPNYIYHLNRTPNDPDFTKLWGQKNIGQEDSDKTLGVTGVDIGAEKAWDIQTGNQELLIAVIDTGIDYNHQDLKENIWINQKELNGAVGIDDDGNGFIDDIHGYDFANNDGDPMDDQGHGSHCSGTIGAKGDDNLGIVGVAWNVRLMGVKFLDSTGSGKLDAAIEAINYATKMGARIMSNSWGGGAFSELMKAAIDNAGSKGIIFTAAAGNHSGNNDITPSYPASYDLSNVISVAAIDNQGVLADFSCYGKKTVHVGAPGVNIYSSVAGGTYDSWSGTSMATPHVSGVIALLLSNEPNLTPEQVKTRLIQTSKPLSGLRGKIASNGIVDAYFALINQIAPPDLNDPANWSNSKLLSISTAHPYEKNANQSWEIQVSGANEIALHFEKFNTETKYDKLTLYDRQGKRLAEMTGDRGETWSPNIVGDYVKIVFTSDDTVSHFGFDINKVSYR